MSSDRPTKLPRTVPKPGSISPRGIRRHSADSKAGRQIAAGTSRIDQGPGPTDEQKRWNAEIAARQAAKQAAKEARRNPAAPIESEPEQRLNEDDLEYKQQPPLAMRRGGAK